MDVCTGIWSGLGWLSPRLSFLLPRQDRRPQDSVRLLAVHSQRAPRGGRPNPNDPTEIALWQKEYQFPAALRTEQGQQW